MTKSFIFRLFLTPLLTSTVLRRQVLGAGLLLISFQAASGECPKSSYVMAWSEMPPYMLIDSEGKITGLDIQFIQAVFKQLNCPLKLARLPWKRSLYEVQKGRVDFLGLASLVAERQQFAYYSTPYRLEQVRIAIRKGEAERWHITSLEQLAELNMRLNVQLGAWYGPAYAQAIQQEGFKQLVREDTENDKQVLRLINNRADGVFNDVLYFDHFVMKYQQAGKIELLPFVVHDNPVHFIFSKASISQESFNKINEVIKAVKKTPFYHQLYKQSVVSDVVVD
ncbi:substrate-binding periplasmic protein [Spartinivicinus poritis]|uniref:Transporter substrate-binding domain-containing protein n=1 Tax=Spartinivicinus poritis TaxID=2994640 RepID=A0ABT5UD37_9GAMM|nr:transporter substrate-binding domain-containing protein [Spartinivicinus sp. A2-2]MDE1463422.1 transporter substrate-binding domain-containing protein [Spartinivicinus sp. A2-2]